MKRWLQHGVAVVQKFFALKLWPRLLLALMLLPPVLLPLGSLGHAADPELLEPDKAFRFSASAIAPDLIEVRYRIAPGYYLYRDKFQFSASVVGMQPVALQFAAPRMPRGELHQDAFFGSVETYRGALVFQLPLQAAFPPGQSFELSVTSQGCADVGVCYVPQVQRARIVAVAGSVVASSADAADDSALQSDESHYLALLQAGLSWRTLLFFFIAGLALTFTPCVLPMVPILSGIIVGQQQLVQDAHHHHRPGESRLLLRQAARLRALALSLAYVLGMALTYTAIGVAAALSGQLFSALLQNAWVLGAFASLFVLLGLSMFGLFDLRLPLAVSERLHRWSLAVPGGRYGGVLLLGMLSAAIVSPCVAAPLAGALLYISQQGDVWLGGSALFVMALGMGVPLIVVGVTEGALLPRAGRWMNRVKQAFGVLMLAVAVWIVLPVLPASLSLPGWLSGSSAHSSPAPQFVRIDDLDQLAQQLRSAGQDRPVMLDFYADWCVSCKEMERYTFADAAVRERMDRLLLLQVDVTANTPAHRELLKRFRLFGPPGILFFAPGGRELPGLRVIGYQPAEKFVRVLDAVFTASAADAAPARPSRPPPAQ
jgi:thiol:disulfide interchange protein DsbD